MKSVSAPVIDHRTMKPRRSDIPQIVRYQVKFLSLQNFYSTKILQSLEFEVYRISAHSSVCRSLQTIPCFVGLFTSNKSYNPRNINITWCWPVPQFGGYQRKFPTLLVFNLTKSYYLRNRDKRAEVDLFLSLKVMKEIPHFVAFRWLDIQQSEESWLDSELNLN